MRAAWMENPNPNQGKHYIYRVKTQIPATLICVDTTRRAWFSHLAISQSMSQADFADVQLLSNQNEVAPTQLIPEIKGLEGYSQFCIRDMNKYVTSPFALVVQYDGFVLNGSSWSDDFLNWDFVGAPFNPSGVVGNGGFSLRSKRLLEYMARAGWADCHPEDSAISIRHRNELQAAGFKFAPREVAARFAIEGRSWDSVEWSGVPNAYTNQFGFHSLLTVLPPDKKPCKIFHHSGDAGDIIYGMAAIKALGGGMLFISTDNRFPYPKNSRWAREDGGAAWVDNIAPLIECQDYMWGCRYTHGLPYSTDYDLNKFREPWKELTSNAWNSILRLHMDAFKLKMPTSPWLSVPDPIVVEGKPLVINRTGRYQNFDFPWQRFIEKYHEQMLFVGTEQEYSLFRGFAPLKKVQYYPTKNALELARVIAGGQRFIGNQSFALSIAHGLCKPVMVEEWPLNANCRWKRPQAFYGMPKSWL